MSHYSNYELNVKVSRTISNVLTINITANDSYTQRTQLNMHHAIIQTSYNHLHLTNYTCNNLYMHVSTLD